MDDKLLDDYAKRAAEYYFLEVPILEALAIAKDDIKKDAIRKKKKAEESILFHVLKCNETLDINKLDETLDKFVTKSVEEFIEMYIEAERIIEVISGNSYPKLTSELLDEIQLRVNLIWQLHHENKINAFDEINNHNNKMDSRGWEYSDTYKITKE